jgi:hypothetical protein
MKRTILQMAAVVVGAAMLVTGPALAALDEEEGCQAFNPGQPTCTYTSTHEGTSPVTGIAGVGSWIVKVKVGKQVETVKSPATGEPTAISETFAEGTKVSVKTLAPGSAVVVGHVD